MNKKNVLHLVQFLYLGGLERLLHQFAKNSPKNIEPHFFAYETEKLAGIGLEIKKMGHKVNCLAKKDGYDLGLVKTLNNYIKENNIEVLHTHDFGPMEYATALKVLNPKLKLIHTQHTIHHFLPNWKYRWFFQFATYFYKKVICVSNFQYEEIKKACPLSCKNLMVVPNGVDINFFRHQDILPNPKQLRLVNLSRISPEKNLKYILQTCLKLKEQNIDFEFHHAGAGNPFEEEKVDKFISQNNLLKEVHLHGYKSDVRDILKKGDIYITSSLEECHPVSLLEAMAAGKACFCSNIAPHLEISKNALVFFDLADENSLYELLTKKDQDFKNLSTNAREKVVNSFSFKKMVSEYVQRYQL